MCDSETSIDDHVLSHVIRFRCLRLSHAMQMKGTFTIRIARREHTTTSHPALQQPILISAFAIYLRPVRPMFSTILQVKFHVSVLRFLLPTI